MTRAIIIGDLHGCSQELEDLLRACDHGPTDQVVSVGDLVAKGPDSRGVIDRVRAVGGRAVLGNHDEHVLNAARMSMKQAREHRRLHHHAVASELGEDRLAWLAGLPLVLELPRQGVAGENVLVVHGGLLAGVPLAAQQREHMLSMRSIRPDGTPSKRIEGEPWASLWPGPEHVVFGHDAVRGLQRHPHATGLDTGCVYGGRLTALVLPEGRLVSTPARKAYVGSD